MNKYLKMAAIWIFSSSIAFSLTPAELNKKSIFKDTGSLVDNVIEVDKTGLFLASGKDKNNKDFKVGIDKDAKYLFLIKQIIPIIEPEPINISTLKGKESFSYGNGPKELFVFVDPTCHYCKEFEKSWPSLKEKYTLKVFLYDIGLSKSTPSILNYVLGSGSNETAGDRVIKIAQGDSSWKSFSLPATKALDVAEKLDNSKKAGQALGINGTPAVYDSKGNQIKNWPAL